MKNMEISSMTDIELKELIQSLRDEDNWSGLSLSKKTNLIEAEKVLKQKGLAFVPEFKTYP